jgi:hypothetical protein
MPTIVLRDGTELELPEGMSSEEMRAAVEQFRPGETKATAPTYEEKMQRPLSERITDPGLMWEHIKRASPLQLFRTENLPSTAGAIGGAIGTLGGPVGTAGGAALGGATGRWAQAMLEGKGEEALPEMAKSAALEGALSAVPAGVAGAMRGIGGKMILADVVPALQVIKERAKSEGKLLLPKAKEIAGTIQKYATRTPQQAEEALQGVTEQLTRATGEATAAGKTLALEPRLRENLGELAKRVEKEYVPGKTRRGVAKKVEQFYEDSPLTRTVPGTYPEPAPTDLTEAMRGVLEEARTVTPQTAQLRPGVEPQQFVGRWSAYPKGEMTREVRPDITPTEALAYIEANAGKLYPKNKGKQATVRMIDRAVRDAFKEAVPAAATLQPERGALIQAKAILDPLTLKQARGPWSWSPFQLAQRLYSSSRLPVGIKLSQAGAPINAELLADAMRAALMEGFETTPEQQ